MAPQTPSRGASWLTAILLLSVLLLLGVLVGGLIATRVFASPGMGWDQLANALGGVLAGGLVAVVVWILALRALGPIGRLVLIGLAIIGSGATWAYLATASPSPRAPSRTASNVPPLVASFAFELGTTDGLAGPVPGAQRLRWQTLRIASNLSFSYVRRDRPNLLCVATDALTAPDDIARLTMLRETLSRLPRAIDCAEPCPACDEVGLHWSLDDARSTLSVTDRCWLTHEQLQALRAAADAVVTPHLDRVTCETLAG